MYSMQTATERAGVAILAADKTDFRSKKVTKDKEGCSILIKNVKQKEDRT